MAPKTDAQKEEIGRRNKAWIKEHGHPRGMLGKPQTEKSRKVSGALAKEMWANPKSRVNTDEYRQMLSDRAKDQHKNGMLNENYSRAKMGRYDINGKEIFFRSSWEANYALYLDFLIKQGQVKSWEFEADTFWFEAIRRGVRSYKPDFKVVTDTGRVEYHEVKGYMDQKSKTKISRMAKYHPDIRLIVIDQEAYRDISSKIGKMLKFY